MVNRDNYKLFQRYLAMLADAQQLDQHSVSRYEAYLKHTLRWLDETPLCDAHQHRPTLAEYLGQVCSAGGKPLAAATKRKITGTTRRLIEWAKDEEPKGFKETKASWLKALSRPSTRTASTARERVFVSLEEILAIARLEIPADDLPRRREQAAACFLFLSGIRASAFATLPLSAVNVGAATVKQWPELGVRTKNSKRATTYLINIPEVTEVVRRWDAFLRQHLSADAMWFAVIDGRWGAYKLTPDAPGHNRGTALAKGLRKFFEYAEMPYRNPHAFRHGNAVYGLEHAATMADYQAVSANLMHGSVTITDAVYARLPGDSMKARIAGLGGQPAVAGPASTDMPAYLQNLSPAERVKALQWLANDMKA